MKTRDKKRKTTTRSKVNPLRLDPTRTTMLRSALSRELARKFSAINLALDELVHRQDMFGLSASSSVFNVFCPTGEGGGVDPTCSKSKGQPLPKTEKEAEKIAKELRSKLVEEGNCALDGDCQSQSFSLVGEYPDAEVWAGGYEQNPEQHHLIVKLGNYFIDVTADQFPGGKGVETKVFTEGEMEPGEYAEEYGGFRKTGLADTMKKSMTANSFCPTGKGGGIDPTCSSSGVRATWERARGLKKVSEEAAEKVYRHDFDSTAAIHRDIQFKTGSNKAADRFADSLLAASSRDPAVLMKASEKIEKRAKALLESLDKSPDSVRPEHLGELKMAARRAIVSVAKTRELYKDYAVKHAEYRRAVIEARAAKNGLTGNSFCPTGKGGGIDPTCSPNEKSNERGRLTDTTKSRVDISPLLPVDEAANLEILERDDGSYRGRVKSVPIAGLIATQPRVDPSKVKFFVEHPGVEGKEEILIWRMNGEDYIGDGHHRIVAAKLRGESEVRARYIVMREEAIENAAGDVQLWRFDTNAEKLKKFQEWLRQQMFLWVLGKDEEELWREYVERGYRKGAGRAFDDVKRAGATPDERIPFYLDAKDQFLRSAFAHPVAVEKVKLLVSRAFTDLKGVTEAMSTSMTRTLADGLVQGISPRDLGRRLAKDVDGIGKARATLIARTEIIRAHAEGQLDALTSLGVEEVGAQVEWSTTGDAKVCPMCRPLQGVVIKIDRARGMLPRHPNCRCAWIPAGVGEDDKGQIKTRDRVRAAVRRSVAAGSKKDKWRPAVLNSFCPTGKGGGVDPSCSPPSRFSSLADGTSVKFVPHDSARGRSARYRTIMVDAAKMDVGWSRDEGFYIPSGGGGSEIGGRRERFKSFLEKGKPIEAPKVYVTEDGKVTFEDGRHRFSVLRDLGIGKVAVTVPRSIAIRVIRQFGGGTTRPAKKMSTNVSAELVAFSRTMNAFCPTGEGGGIDPTCGKGEGKGGKRTTLTVGGHKIVVEEQADGTGKIIEGPDHLLGKSIKKKEKAPEPKQESSKPTPAPKPKVEPTPEPKEKTQREELKTKEEAVATFKEKYHTNLRDRGASEAELLETANYLAETYDRLGEMKAVKAAFKYRETAAKTGRRQELEVGDIYTGDHTHAMAKYKLTEGMSIKTGAGFELLPNESPKLGAYNVHSGMAGTIRHELGHEVFHTGLSNSQKKEWTKIASKHVGKSTVSRYGGTNESELFSESFSAYTNPKYVRGSLPHELESWLDKHVRG